MCRFHTYETTTSTSPREEMVAGREETRDAARAVSVWPSARAAGGGASSQASHCWSVVLPVELTLAVARVRAWVFALPVATAAAASEARHSRRIVVDTMAVAELPGEETNVNSDLIRRDLIHSSCHTHTPDHRTPPQTQQVGFVSS